MFNFVIHSRNYGAYAFCDMRVIEFWPKTNIYRCISHHFTNVLHLLLDNCNNDTEILAANFTKWYNDQTLIETTTALATTSTVSTLSLTTSGTIIKIPVQVKKISKDQNIPTTTAQTTTSNAQPKLISSTLITLLMLAGNCIFSEIL